MGLKFMDSQGKTLQATGYTSAPTAAYDGRSFDLMPLVKQSLYTLQLYSGTQALEHPMPIDLGAYNAVASVTPAAGGRAQDSSQGAQDGSRGGAVGDSENVPVATAHDVDSSTQVA